MLITQKLGQKITYWYVLWIICPAHLLYCCTFLLQLAKEVFFTLSDDTWNGRIRRRKGNDELDEGVLLYISRQLYRQTDQTVGDWVGLARVGKREIFLCLKKLYWDQNAVLIYPQNYNLFHGGRCQYCCVNDLIFLDT